MTTSTTIRRHLEAAREKLAQAQDHVSRLEQQLREAQTLESANARRREQMRAVMARLRSGQWVSGSNGRLWWHKETQTCMEPATPDELDALNALVAQGVVDSGTKRVAA